MFSLEQQKKNIKSINTHLYILILMYQKNSTCQKKYYSTPSSSI